MSAAPPDPSDTGAGPYPKEAWWTAGLYASVFLPFGMILPFWPLWMEDWGASPTEVGFYLGVGMWVRVFFGFAIPVLTDRFDARRGVLMGSALVISAIFLAHLKVETRPWLFALTLLMNGAVAGLPAVTEAFGSASATRGGFDYGKVRSAGSASFVFATLIGGPLVAGFGANAAIWWIVGSFAVFLWVVWRHPRRGRVRKDTRPDMGAILKLAVSPVFLLFVAVASALQGSHAIVYTYGSLHWRALGVAETEIGLLWAFGTLVEIFVLFALGKMIVRRCGAVGSMALAGAAGVLRWSVMMSDPTGAVLYAMQGLHALTFGAAHLGAIAFIARAVPDPLAATAQGISMSVTVAFSAILTLIAAPMIAGGGGIIYAVALGASVAGIAGAAALARGWNGGQLARV